MSLRGQYVSNPYKLSRQGFLDYSAATNRWQRPTRWAAGMRSRRRISFSHLLTTPLCTPCAAARSSWHSIVCPRLFRDRLMAGHRTLTAAIVVRIHVPEPALDSPSESASNPPSTSKEDAMKAALLALQLLVPATDVHKVNFSCGFKPFPPFGCQVGPCICDSAGRNCQWQMICR